MKGKENKIDHGLMHTIQTNYHLVLNFINTGVSTLYQNKDKILNMNQTLLELRSMTYNVRRVNLPQKVKLM